MDQSRKKIIKELSGFITQRRRERFERVLDFRTRYITLVLEDIYQSHNASAVLRTCECFGIQDVHIIENRNTYNINPDVVLGAAKWLNLKKYNRLDYNSNEAIRDLRERGYRIIATTLNEKAVALNNFNLHKGKCALFFGTELTGLTDQMLDQADEVLQIPLYGFTESLNISVSAAIILNQLTMLLHWSDLPWQLSKAEREELLVDWLKKSARGGEKFGSGEGTGN
jgi:tRNA (guanosine-2'-O-)-methyltransferase